MDDGIEQLVPAVEQQLDSPETHYVKEAYQRLLQDPEIDEQEAKLMIALCLSDESERMLDEESEFDSDRYQTLLAFLPKLPG